MPDLSLLEPLSKELNITINELISGEKISKDKYKEKLEENIINTIDYTDKKMKKNIKKFKIIIGTIILFIFTLVTLFCIDINRMRNNKPVLFSTWGYCYAPPIDLHREEINYAILNYIVKKGDAETKHHDNEKTFASIKVYLIEEKEKDKLYNVYAWVLQEKYYLENNEIIKDSGFSIPHKFVVEYINNEYIVTDERIPRDGSYYENDIKNIFPKSIIEYFDEVYTDGTIDTLSLDIEHQAKLYFLK